MALTANSLTLALATNSTAASFTAKIPTTSAPSGDGVFDITSSTYRVGARIASHIALIPFCTAANNVTFSMRMWGWSQKGSASLYIPELITELACTAGNISGSAIAANHFMVDTIVVTYGPAAGFYRDLNSPANDLTAEILLALRGNKYIEFDFSINSGTATAMNAYWRLVDHL